MSTKTFSARLLLKSTLSLFFFLFISCQNSSTSPTPDGPLHPPSWIQGVWEGGSPIKLHLEFTANTAFNGSGVEQFTGYTETGISESAYSLTKGSMMSVFTKVSAIAMDWYVNNGSISNTTRMIKQ
jgi:hypothetical protein